MIDSIVNSLRESLPRELVIFIVSMLPILELRGGLIAAAILDVSWFVAFPICVIGNMLPIPFILLFLKKVFELLKKFKYTRRLVLWLETKANQKSGKLHKYRFWGLFLFVGIPLPGTGAWTGALVADAVDIRIKHSFPIIFAGVIAAGLIISIISYVIPSFF
ncbi:MAG: small multi-drug export protein [Oscillospiraceae bacterium]